MNYADTLRVMQHSYPSLFPYEWNALCQCFFTNGNGMEWIGGELIAHDDDGKLTPDEAIAKAQSYHVRQEERDIAKADDDWTREYHQKKLALLQSPIEEQWAAEIAYRRKSYEGAFRIRDEGRCWWPHPDGSVASRLYPLCQYARILHIPADVKPDWLAAAEKAFAYVESGHLRPSSNDMPWLEKALKLISKRRMGA